MLLLTALFMGNGEDDNITRDNAAIGPEVAVSQPVEG